MHRIAVEVILGVFFAVFLGAMIWVGFGITVMDPVEPRYRARHRR